MKRRILKKLMAFTMAVTVIAGSTVPALAEQTQNESVKIVTPQLEVVRKDGKIEGIKFINNSDAENVMMYDFCTEEEIELLKNGSMELETGVSMYSNEEYEISLASLWTVREIGEKDYLVTYCEDEDGNYSDLFVLEELYFSCTEKNMDTSISYGVGEISGNIYFPTISTKDYNWAAAKYMRSEPEADDDFAQEELSVMGEVYCLRTEEEYTYEVLETYAAKVSEKDGACLIEVENYTNIQKEDNYEEKVTDTPRLTVNSRNTVRGIYLENPGDMEVWAELYLVKEGEEVSTDIFLSSEYLEPGQKEYLPFEPIFHYADNVEPGNYSIVAMAYSEDYPESEWTVLEDFTVVFEEEAMESAKVGVGHSTGNYYFTDTNKDEWLYGNVVYEYTDDETEESKEYLYWTKGMLSLDAAYLNDAYDQWELKEANLYKMQYGKEQVQFSRCHTEKFELNVYEEPIPKAAQLELYREDDKVVGIKAKNVMDEDVYIEFYILNENVEEWMMGEILPAGGSAIILFNDINLSGISSGAYELKARVYDWDYEFYSDWINTGYALVIEDTTYTGKNVQVTKAYDEEYDSYLYNIDVAQFGPFENLAEAFCLEEDGQEDSERIYKTISGKYWQFGSEASDELTGIKHCVMDADDQKITCYTSVIPKEKLVISEIAWKDAPGNVTAEFSDVYTDWYTEYVQYVYDMGMMIGIKGTDRFEPNANITKAQVAQVLYNLAGQPSVKDRTAFKELKDVYEGEWYADAVAWAYNEGIVTGDLNTKKFNPNANVTREQLALMFSRYAEMEGRDTGYQSDLKDLQNAENVSDWALDGVKWAVAVGLISGIEKDGVKDLAPQGNATRAQVAAILMRFTQGN